MARATTWQRRKSSVRCTAVVVCGVVAFGCSDAGVEDNLVAVAKPAVEKVQKDAAPVAANEAVAVVEAKAGETQGGGQNQGVKVIRDPFRTYFDELREADDVNRNLTELQKFDLPQLKLVGVMVGTATPMAIVEDPSGQGHTVRIGSLMGKKFGQVKTIRRGEVIVQEEYVDFSGTKKIRQLQSLKIENDDEKLH